MAGRTGDDPNVLEEAEQLTAGARAEAYGSARDNAETWAHIMAAVTGLDVKPEHFPIAMIALKLARIGTYGGFHRDSWVDLAGYARVAEMVEDDRPRTIADRVLAEART